MGRLFESTALDLRNTLARVRKALENQDLDTVADLRKEIGEKWNGICYLYFDALDWGPADPVEQENWDSLSRCCIDLFNLATSAKKNRKECLRIRKEFGRLDSELSSLIGIRTRFKVLLDDPQEDNLHE